MQCIASVDSLVPFRPSSVEQPNRRRTEVIRVLVMMGADMVIDIQGDPILQVYLQGLPSPGGSNSFLRLRPLPGFALLHTPGNLGRVEGSTPPRHSEHPNTGSGLAVMWSGIHCGQRASRMGPRVPKTASVAKTCLCQVTKICQQTGGLSVNNSAGPARTMSDSQQHTDAPGVDSEGS